MVDDTISIADPVEAPASDPIAIASESSIPLPSENTANSRAIKASIGLPFAGGKFESIAQQFMNGQEDFFRKQAAATLDLQDTVKRNELITHVANQEGRRLTLPEVALIEELAKKKQQDPNTVIEEGYAKTFMENLRTTAEKNPDSFMAAAFKNNSVVVEDELNKGKDYKARRELITTLKENLEEIASKQSWGGYAVDVAKGLTPLDLYRNIKLRGLIPGAPTFEGGLGTNFDKQAAAAFNLPWDQFKTLMPAIAKKLSEDNPQLAAAYFSALLDQSQGERILNNFFPLIDITLLGDAVALGVGAKNAIRSLNQIRTNIRQAASAVDTPVGRVAMEEAAGNIKESAIEQTTLNIMDRIKGTEKPVNEVLQGFQSIFAREATDITGDAAGIRLFGQELINRLAERTTSMYDSFIDTTKTIMRVDRLSAVFAVKKNLAILAEVVKEELPGLENTISNIKFRKDGLGNTHVDFYLSRDGVSTFGTERTAEAHIFAHQLGDAKVVEISGPIKTTINSGVWRSKDTDYKVRILNESHKGPDGKTYQKVIFEGKETFVPKDELFSSKNLEKTTRIEQQGPGFYVVKSIPLTETRPYIRDLLAKTADSQTPQGMLNSAVGFLRTPEATLAHEQILAGKVATFGPARFVELIKENYKEITKARGWVIPGTKKADKWKDWKRVMDISTRDPETGELSKVSFRTPGELADLYQNTLHRLPDPQEVLASFAHKRNGELAHAINIQREFNRQTRLGAQTWTIRTGDIAKQTKDEIPFKKIDINGVGQKDIPTTGTILLIGGREGEEVVVSAKSLSQNALGKKILEAVEAGSHNGAIIRLTNPNDFPFKYLGKVGEQYITHVISATAESKTLDWSKLKVGKISDTDYEHYVSQAKIHRDTVSNVKRYLGDVTIAPFNVRAMGRDVAEKLDTIRKFLQKGDEAGAIAYHATTKLPQEWSEIQSWFRHGVTTEGLPIGPKLSLDEPIRLVPRGKTIYDLDKEMQTRLETGGFTFKDATRESYGRFEDNLRDPFDVFTARNVGTKGNPIYNLAPVEHIDPLTSINRALTKAINGQWLDDYKISSIERWIQEAKPYLKISDSDLESAPGYWFHQAGQGNLWKDGTSQEIKNNLTTANLQTRQFLGIQDAATTWLHSATQALSDSVYTNISPRIAILPDHILPFTRDPAAAVRTFVFHAKVGLFAVPQLWVQANTYAAVFGIAGSKYAAPGTKAALLHTWARVNESPEVLAKLDAIASTKFLPGTSHWKPGEWLEARDLLKAFGFDRVAGEHIYRDSTLYYDFFKSKVDSFLNVGQWFFQEGEKQVRIGAFYTAYREFRDKVPFGKLTEAMQREILQRADLLSVNMSRASASQIHKGIFSIPTQFLSYQLRLSELAMGKRLTSTEKIRLFSTYSVVYGIPGAFGLTGLPIGDYIMRAAQEGGYITGHKDNSYLNSAVTEGIPALIAGLVTGNWYNIRERYGPTGFEVLRDSMRSDKTFWDIVGGASFSTLSNTIANMDGFTRAVLDGMNKEGKFKLKIEDLIEPFKEISSISNGVKLYSALSIGRLLSKKEGYLTDVTPANAIFMSVFGLQPEGVNSLVTQSWIQQDEKVAHKKGLDAFVKEMRRAFQAQDQKNPEQALDYQKRAWRWLDVTGFPRERYSEAISIATQDHESIINRSNYNFFLGKDVDERRRANAISTYQKTIQPQSNK